MYRPTGDLRKHNVKTFYNLTQCWVSYIAPDHVGLYQQGSLGACPLITRVLGYG